MAMDQETKQTPSSSSSNDTPSITTPLSNLPQFLPSPSSSSFTITPGLGLLAASFPLFAGTYIGYRREVIHAQSKNTSYIEKLSSKLSPTESSFSSSKSIRIPRPSSSSTSISSSTAVAVTEVSPAFFARAFLYGTLLSIGGVSFLSAGVFYATGCHSLEELLESCREWTPKTKQRFESMLGVKDSKSQWENDVDVKNTKDMNEDEELEYYTNKYAGEDVWKNQNGQGTK